MSTTTDMVEIKPKRPVTVRRPRKQIHETPRILMADAYTIGSNPFESELAREKSVYYSTYRKLLHDINPKLYKSDDTRIVFKGITRLVDYLLYEPITHEEIDEAKRFLEHQLITGDGLTRYYFPEELWRRVVDEFDGWVPIKISAVREGTIVYPNEPVMVTESTADGFGVLAAWPESKGLMTWAPTEMVTQDEHWLLYLKTIVRRVFGDTLNEDEIDFQARLALHNFGDRAGICPQESEWLGADTLFTFPGTDTFAGAYQFWKNNDEKIGSSMSVYALAHRNVQGFEHEFEAYRALYDFLQPKQFGSFVADAYDFWNGVEGDATGKDDSLLALALESKKTGNGKVVVGRPDSGDAKEQVLWLCRLALKHGLYEEKVINGKVWRFSTYLKFIEGDGMTWEQMEDIMEALLLQGFYPMSWGLFGVGGGLRNGLKRDNLSAKWALCAIGNALKGVVKFSETLGKGTLPGPFKLLRTKEALDKKQTIVFAHEPGESILEPYYNGALTTDPFYLEYYDSLGIKSPMQEWESEKQARTREQLKTMPPTLSTEENHNYPASEAIRLERRMLLKKYAPKKLAQNY